MEQLVRVRAVKSDGRAEVIHVRESACSGDCHKCSGCGAAKESVIFMADNPIGAVPGDLVRVESDTAPVLKAAAVLYILPLVLFFLGYWLGSFWSFGTLGGGLGFILGGVLVVLYDRKIQRAAETRYTITALVSRGAERREEDDHG